MKGTVHQLNLSKGGVPKLPVESVRVTKSGIVGDGHDKPKIHGGPLQAVSLFALERIEALAAEGHPVSPGSLGENVTTRGIDWAALDPGMRLSLGSDVVVEITNYAVPCKTIKANFSDGKFKRLSQLAHPGWSRLYAEVLREGVVRPGDVIEVLK